MRGPGVLTPKCCASAARRSSPKGRAEPSVTASRLTGWDAMRRAPHQASPVYSRVLSTVQASA